MQNKPSKTLVPVPCGVESASHEHQHSAPTNPSVQTFRTGNQRWLQSAGNVWASTLQSGYEIPLVAVTHAHTHTNTQVQGKKVHEEDSVSSVAFMGKQANFFFVMAVK